VEKEWNERSHDEFVQVQVKVSGSMEADLVTQSRASRAERQKEKCRFYAIRITNEEIEMDWIHVNERHFPGFSFVVSSFVYARVQDKLAPKSYRRSKVLEEYFHES
ncbi:hypothetical protein AVEN_14668-1, partial [Araneus ventricosus]